MNSNGVFGSYNKPKTEGKNFGECIHNVTNQLPITVHVPRVSKKLTLITTWAVDFMGYVWRLGSGQNESGLFRHIQWMRGWIRIETIWRWAQVLGLFLVFLKPFLGSFAVQRGYIVLPLPWRGMLGV